MKIAFIALRGIPLSDGIVKYTDGVAPILVEKGHEITVYTSKRYGNSNGIYNGYKIVSVPSLSNKYFEKMSLVFMASLHMLFQKYDIVHYHAMGPSIFSFLGKLSGKKVIIQSHGIEHQRSKWGQVASHILKATEKMSINMGDQITVVSKNLKKYFLNEYKKDTVYIPTAVTLPRKREASLITTKWDLLGNDYFFFMARIVKEKGLHTLIAAFKKSKTTKKLIIAGPIDTEDLYTLSLLNEAKSDERIIFVGQVEGILKEELLSNAYVFCQPSELEGLSVSLLEAMSYKNCCLISDIPENMEVADSVSIIFENKDIEDCSKQIDYIDSHPELVEKYGELAFDVIKKEHQLFQIADKLENLYIETLRS